MPRDIGGRSRSPLSPLSLRMMSRGFEQCEATGRWWVWKQVSARAKSRSAGVLACEFWRRPAARGSAWNHRRVRSLHRDGAGTRRRGRLRYMAAAPLPIFRASAKAGVHRIHERVVAATMQVLIVADEVFVGFTLPEWNHFLRQAFVDFVRRERFPTVQDVAQGVAGHRPNDDMGVVRHDHPRT